MGVRLRHHYCAGGLVVRDGRVLLIRTHAGRWQLPKGHLESGETAIDAARREVREETGVDAAPREQLGSIRFHYRGKNGRDETKHVEYFLLDYRAGSEDDHDPNEVAAARWFEWIDAVHRLSFDNERSLVERARRRHSTVRGVHGH